MEINTLRADMIGNRISWSAVFAGMVIALIFSFLLNLLGLGLGFTVFTTNAHALSNLGMSSIIWLVISGVISALAGGFIAGRFSNVSLSFSSGALHGVLTWGFSMLLTIMFTAATIGTIGGGLIRTLGAGVSVAGQSTAWLGKTVAQEVPKMGNVAADVFPEFSQTIEKIKGQAKELLKQTSESRIQALNETPKNQLLDNITEWFKGGSEGDIASARQKIISLLAEHANMSEAETEQVLRDWEEKYKKLKEEAKQKSEEMKQKTIEVVESASHVSGAILLMLFWVFLIGVSASGVGGALGARRQQSM